jgi:hypothetical protein
MRGNYFTRLAEQSGLAIGVRNQSARARPASYPLVPAVGAEAPLHVETVDWANSVPPSEGGGLPSSSVERSTRDQDASEGAWQPTRNKQQIPSGSEQAERQLAASALPNPSIATSSDDSNKRIVELSETSFFRHGSTRSATLEKAGERGNVAGSSSEGLKRSSGGMAGVIRVGDHGNSIEQKPAPETDPFTEVARVIARHEPSIPGDYLADIREWLSSPMITSEAIETTESRDVWNRNPRKVSTAQEQADRSLQFNLVPRDSAPQNDIQEFSLSIGRISIVVEQPAQPPKERAARPQPVERKSASGQSGARDTFALSRSYFRGF